MVMKDAHKDIMCAQLGKLLGKYSCRILIRNGDGKSLLMCSGLSSLVNKYEDMLNPHWGDHGYHNYSFNPKTAIDEILSEIKLDNELFGLFVNEFLERLTNIDDEDIDRFQNILSVLGYTLEVKEKEKCEYYDETEYNYSLIPFSDGSSNREANITYLTKEINNKDGDLLRYYTEAISTYGNGEYKSCISNCRTLFEGLFSKYDKIDKKIQKGIINFTQEKAKPGKSCALTQKKIFNYWLENNEGFNRFRLLSTMYSFMSAFEHGEEIETREDALFCLRLVEDILIWYYSKEDSIDLLLF